MQITLATIVPLCNPSFLLSSDADTNTDEVRYHNFYMIARQRWSIGGGRYMRS